MHNIYCATGMDGKAWFKVLWVYIDLLLRCNILHAIFYKAKILLTSVCTVYYVYYNSIHVVYRQVHEYTNNNI